VIDTLLKFPYLDLILYNHTQRHHREATKLAEKGEREARTTIRRRNKSHWVFPSSASLWHLPTTQDPYLSFGLYTCDYQEADAANLNATKPSLSLDISTSFHFIPLYRTTILSTGRYRLLLYTDFPTCSCVKQFHKHNSNDKQINSAITRALRIKHITSQPLTSFIISRSRSRDACCRRYASRSPSANRSGTR
jgi:hypothetical protein